MDLTDDDVRAILRLLDTSAFDDLVLETDSFRLSLQRGDGGWTQELATLGAPAVVAPGLPLTAPDTAPAVPPASGGVAPAAATAAAVATPPPSADGLGLVNVETPLPGTFYRSPKPGAPPFVAVGQRVDADTVVAIVETMKLMNSVYAGVRGHVAQLCLADAEFAAQGAVLMRIRPEPA